MNPIIKLATIISLVIGVIKLSLMGNLSPQAAGLLLIGAVFLLAGGKKVFIIVSAALSLYLFVKIYSGGNAQQAAIIFQALLTLIIISIGFWVMFKGIFNNK